MEHALRLVDTWHVMVVQDDRVFTRRMADLERVLGVSKHDEFVFKRKE